MSDDSYQPSAFVTGLVDAMKTSVQPFREAVSLPREIYTSPEFYEFERSTIFSREWLGLGHHNQIPKAGDYFTVQIMDEPLIVIRQQDGSIKVLSAICQHRGHPLIFDAEKEQTGNAGGFTCPYHAWSYKADGSLMGAPDMRDTIPLPQHQSCTRLPELKVELFHGFIFANFDHDAAPLAPTLGKADAELSNYNFEDMHVVEASRFEGYPWNWKISIENGLEPYHTSYVHRGYHEMAPAHRATFTEWEDWSQGENYITHPTYFTQMDGAFNPMGKAQFPIISGLTDEERSRTVFSAIPPTIFLCLMPDRAFTFRIFPRGVDKIDLFLNFYYPKTSAKLEMFDWMHSLLAKATHTFGDQDEVTNSTMQKAYRSRFAPRGRYSKLEAILPQFNRWLFEKYSKGVG